MIKKIESLNVDYKQMRADYESVLYKALPNGWDENAIQEAKQVNIRGDYFFHDGLNGKGKTIEEIKYWRDSLNLHKWHSECPDYTKTIIDSLCNQENFIITRARYICHAPGRGLTFHKDDGGFRYHFVLETNPAVLFSFVNPGEFHKNLDIHHLSCCNYFYKIDTTKTHFVYNAGHTNRIHMVLS